MDDMLVGIMALFVTAQFICTAVGLWESKHRGEHENRKPICK
jgi:hypothetical protein